MFLFDAWAVVIDFVMLAILIWIASGLYMWYQLRQTWFWGAIALGSGVTSFLVFLLGL